MRRADLQEKNVHQPKPCYAARVRNRKQVWSSGYDDCLTRSRSPGQPWAPVYSSRLFATFFPRANLFLSEVERNDYQWDEFRDSIVVSISACHADDPGSIPGRGVSS